MIGAVLFLPVIGLILALSSVLTNPTLISETSFYISQDNYSAIRSGRCLAILDYFCVGISYGLAKDKKQKSPRFQ